MKRWLLLILAVSTLYAEKPAAERKIHRVTLPVAPDTLDPQHAYDQSSIRVIMPIYDTLLAHDPFKVQPCELRPCLLEELPRKELLADGQVDYVCRLKQGIKFHDDPCFRDGKGREVVAADVRYTFQRLCDPAVDSPFAHLFASKITGFAEALESAKTNGGKLDYQHHQISGIEVVDARTVRIRLKEPWPQLLYWLAYPATSPVAREAVEYYDGKNREPFGKHPVGTGPFRLKVNQPSDLGTRFALVRHPGYTTMRFPAKGWPAERDTLCAPLAGKALPILDEVQIQVLRFALPAWELFVSGQLDQVLVSKDAQRLAFTADNQLAPEWVQRGVVVESFREPATFFLAFNCEDPVVGKNKKLRQALASAYHAEDYSRTFHDSTVPVAKQLLPPGIAGHEPGKKNPYGYNLERARALLAEAGFPDGRDPKTGQALEITLDAITDGHDYRLRAEFDRACFEKLGVRLKIRDHTFPELLDRKEKGRFQIASGSGWSADYLDPENFFFLFYSKNIPPAGKNQARYRNAEYDQLFERMAPMEDGPERLKLIARMADLLAEDCPIIPVFHKVVFRLFPPWAPKTHSHPMLEDGFAYLTVDPAMREAREKEWKK